MSTSVAEFLEKESYIELRHRLQKKIARKAQRHFAYFHVTLHFFLLHPVAMSTATIFRFFWFILYTTLDGFTKCYTRILQAPNYSTRRPLSKFATKCKSFLHQTFEFKACNFVCYIFFRSAVTLFILC